MLNRTPPSSVPHTRCLGRGLLITVDSEFLASLHERASFESSHRGLEQDVVSSSHSHLEDYHKACTVLLIPRLSLGVSLQASRLASVPLTRGSRGFWAGLCATYRRQDQASGRSGHSAATARWWHARRAVRPCRTGPASAPSAGRPREAQRGAEEYTKSW